MSLKIWLFFFFLLSSLHADDSIVYLTWQRDPTTTMTIQWLTKSDETSDVVEFCKDQMPWKKCEGFHIAAPDDHPYLIHRVELTDLESNTLYRFRIKSEEFCFCTMPKTLDSPIRFITGGDMCDSTFEHFEKAAKRAAAQNPRFVTIGGDIAYCVSGKKAQKENFDRWLRFLSLWTKIMRDSRGALIPFLPAIGNHEVVRYFNKTPSEAQGFYSLFSMPGPRGYNVLRFGSYLSIILLDSGHTHPVYGAQTQWLKQELATQAATTHRFAVYHVPAYPSARYYRDTISSSIRRHWCPLFEQYGIHATFEHHDHAYKRTHPLLNESVDKFGVVYFGDGCWGSKPRIPKTASRTIYLAKTASTRQFIQVDLTKEKRLFQAMSPDGELIDQYEQVVGQPNAID